MRLFSPTFGQILRPSSVLIAAVIGVFGVHGREIFIVEASATARFIISLSLTFLVFCGLAEIRITRRSLNRLEAFGLYCQASVGALIVYKYLLAHSLLAAFRYSALTLYLLIEVSFLAMVAIFLMVSRSQRDDRERRFFEIGKIIGMVTWLMMLSMALVVVVKKSSLIPVFKIPWLAGAEWFEDRSEEFGIETFSANLDIESPSIIFASPVDTVEFLVLALEGEVWAIKKTDEEFRQDLLFDFKHLVGPLDLESGAARAIFGPKKFAVNGGEISHLFL